MNYRFLLWVSLITFQLKAQPVITNQPANQFAVWGSNATFSVTVTGTGPFTYQWRLNGTNLPNNIISTIAGGQLFDGLAATNTILNSPQGTAVDAAGNLFIADSANNVIRKVGTNGVAKIIAGTGAGGFSGDGGPATNASLFAPAAVIVDSFGNVLIADSNNNRVRKVDTNGIISTVAGNGSIPFPTSAGGNGGQATNGKIYSPTGLALDSLGNLFIADSGDNQIRKVDTSGIITCIANTAGTGGFGGDNFAATSASLNYPEGVAVDAFGNIYIADTVNNRIRKIGISNGRITTIAGTGTAGYSGDAGSATAANLNSPYAVTVNTNGTIIYVADSGNHCLRKITNSVITTIAGIGVSGFGGDGGVATNASLDLPGSISVDSSTNLFVADEGNNRIRKVAANGIITTVAGRNLNDGVAATNGTLNFPYGITRDPFGNFYVADTANGRIRKVDTNGFITTVAGNGTIGFAGDGGPATNACLDHAYGVAADSNGNLFIADFVNHRVRKVNADGIITTYAGNGTGSSSLGNGVAATNIGMRPWGLAVDGSGNLFIADQNNYVRKVTTNGITTRIAGNGSYAYAGDGQPATNSLIYQPTAVCLNNIGELFIAEFGAIRKINTNGIITTIAGKGYTGSGYSGDGGAATNAKLSSCWGLWCDAPGNVYLSDISNVRIRKVDTNGIITTIAGNGSTGFAGDGGSANNASVSLPRGITGDASGNLYLVDGGNNRVRKISYLEFADQTSFAVPNIGLTALNNNYSVVITSASGSVTSSVANIALQLPPVTPVFSASSNAITFTWGTVSNFSYQLQSATNLLAPVWENISAPVLANSNSASILEPTLLEPQRFYRVQLVQ